MPKKSDGGVILFVGGPWNFSWEPLVSAPPMMVREVNAKKYRYKIENLMIGPEPGSNTKPVSAPIYLLDGFDLNSRVVLVVRSAILRKFGYS